MAPPSPPQCRTTILGLPSPCLSPVLLWRPAAKDCMFGLHLPLPFSHCSRLRHSSGGLPQHSLKMKLALQSQESDSIRVCSPVEEAWENLHLERRMDACVLVTMSAHNRWHLRGMDRRVCSLWSSVSLSSCFPIPQTEVGGESHSPLVGQERLWSRE